MQVSELKEYLINNGLLQDILSALGCGHIRQSGEYISASNPDGDNKQAIILYTNDNLTCINYTRQIANNKRTTDIFDLIAYFQQCTFPESLKWACDIAHLDFYKEPEELPESLQIIQLLKSMSTGTEERENEFIKPIAESVLNYYIPIGNVLFQDDGISLDTQREFEIGYDPQTNSVTIPIRDELGTLIAVKARRLKYTKSTPVERRKFPDKLYEDESKYFFLEPGAKSQVLYGLYKNAKAIQNQGVVYVLEAEKSVQQLYDMGYYGVSTGGSKVSKRQIEMLTRLGAKIVFCFDKDITEEDLVNITDGFMSGIDIYAIIDKNDLLEDKESPSDNSEKWRQLVCNNIYKLDRGDKF